MNFPRPSTAGVFFALSDKMTEAITSASGTAKWYLLNHDNIVRLRNSVGFHAALAQLIDALMERVVVPCQLTNAGASPSSLQSADFGNTYSAAQSKYPNLIGTSLPDTLANHLTRAKIGKETRYAPFEFWRDLFKSCREVGIMTGPVTLTASDGKQVKVYPPALPPVNDWLYEEDVIIPSTASTPWFSDTLPEEQKNQIMGVGSGAVDITETFDEDGTPPSATTSDYLSSLVLSLGTPWSGFALDRLPPVDFCGLLVHNLWEGFNGYDSWEFVIGENNDYPYRPRWIDGTVSRRASLTAMQLYQIWLSLMWANWAELGLSVMVQHENKTRTVVYDVSTDGMISVSYDNTETTPLTKTNIVRWERGISYDCQPSYGSFPDRSGTVDFDFYVPDISWNAMHPEEGSDSDSSEDVPSLWDEYYKTPGYARFQAAEQAYFSLQSTAWLFQQGNYCLVYVWVGQDNPVTRLTDNGNDTIDFIRDTMRDTGVTAPLVGFRHSDASGSDTDPWWDEYLTAMEAANYLAVINEYNAAYAADDGVGLDVTDKLMENVQVEWEWEDGSKHSDPPPLPSVTLTVTAYALNPKMPETGSPDIPASTFTPKFSPSTSSSTGNPVWPAYDYIQAGYVASENVACALKFHECLADHSLVSGEFVQGRNISNFDIFQLKVGGSVGTVTEATPVTVAADMLAADDLLPAVEEFPMPAGSSYQYPSQLPTMRMVIPDVYATGYSATLPEGYDDWYGQMPLPLTAWYHPNRSVQTSDGDWLPYKITDSSNKTVWQYTGSDYAGFSIGFEIDGGGSLQSAEAADFGDFGSEWAQLDISAKCGLRAVWNWKSMPVVFSD